MAGTTNDVDLTRAIWRKSQRSSPTSNNCVEIAGNLAGAVAIRDSKDPEGPTLVLTAAEWAAFTGRVKANERDL